MDTPETLDVQPANTGFSSARILLWLGIASIVMLFAGLTSGYIVRQAEGNWKHFELPVAFTVSTIVILVSSLSMHAALLSARKNDYQGVRRYLLLTLGLGFAFVFTQFLGWNSLVSQGVYFVDKSTPSGSFFYVISGLHLAHLAFGLLGLIVTSMMAMRDRYHAGNVEGLKLCATYWHFLDGLWMYLFVFLAVYR
ncbi:MAG: cytochrome c oxidase subunit 3 [Sphingobacteriales bacterium]|jgi:cytochrome c oxidase subunit 3|nr:cytochrome c oxidase subunit 3 [Sphingobacteriales bacterium]